MATAARRYATRTALPASSWSLTAASAIKGLHGGFGVGLARWAGCDHDSRLMGARTTGREAALQMLYALEAAGAPVEQVIREFWRELPGDAEGRPYADEVVRGVAAELDETDARIRAASQNWRLERMTRVDRNLLRMGAWELMNKADVPRAVILDEAVELAKRYGTAESGAFVNGVLDRIADDCGRADGDAETDKSAG